MRITQKLTKQVWFWLPLIWLGLFMLWHGDDYINLDGLFSTEQSEEFDFDAWDAELERETQGYNHDVTMIMTCERRCATLDDKRFMICLDWPNHKFDECLDYAEDTHRRCLSKCS